MDKKEARKKYIDIRKNIPTEIKADKSLKICKRIEELISAKHFDAILLYAPLEYEVDVIKVFNKSLNDNFFFPLTKGDLMTFHKVESPDDLSIGNFNVREPKEYCPEIVFDKEKEYLVIVPGAAFDKKGYRIGYGKGYYDKFFSKNEGVKFTKIGVCFKECFLDEIPFDEYDCPVDEVYFE